MKKKWKILNFKMSDFKRITQVRITTNSLISVFDRSSNREDGVGPSHSNLSFKRFFISRNSFELNFTDATNEFVNVIGHDTVG